MAVIRKRILSCALIAAIWPGAASAQDRLVINMIGVRLEAAIPAGYCLPTEAMKAVDDMLAAADTHNVTHATLRPCSSMDSDAPIKDYYLVKSPRSALASSVSREALLAEMAQHFGKAEWQVGGKATTAINEEMNRELTQTLNTPTEVKGAFGGRGTDADCAYIGGEATVSLGELSFPIQGGACMTAIGNKVITVYAYDEPKGSDGVVRLMQNARNLAMAFEATPLVSPPMPVLRKAP